MKKCTRCGKDKELTEFAFRYKEKGILQSICKECKKELDREDYKREGRRVSIRKAWKKHKQKTRKFVEEYKKTHSCVKCGESRFYVLELHHVEDKTYNIGDMLSIGRSIKSVEKELEKCVVLCANCHRELHYNKSHRNVSPLPDKQ